MTTASVHLSAGGQQHIVLDDVSWEFYEHLLREVGDEHVRVSYDKGRLELMSPLPKHERWGEWIGRLVELVCLERSIRVESLGSTTFRSQAKQRGVEPDKCFYIQHADYAAGIEDAFDPAVNVPPDLALEIDITNRSIDREPIYAALGVPELWRFDGKQLHILHLSSKRKYLRRKRSLAFPFLTMDRFEEFVLRIKDRDQIRVLREFRQWVNALPA